MHIPVVHMWRSEGNLPTSVLSFKRLGLGTDLMPSKQVRSVAMASSQGWPLETLGMARSLIYYQRLSYSSMCPSRHGGVQAEMLNVFHSLSEPKVVLCVLCPRQHQVCFYYGRKHIYRVRIWIFKYIYVYKHYIYIYNVYKYTFLLFCIWKNKNHKKQCGSELLYVGYQVAWAWWYRAPCPQTVQRELVSFNLKWNFFLY